MPETIYVRTPLRVSFDIRKDPSGLYYGHVREYPGILSQGRSRTAVRRKLVSLLREVVREHPEELPLFR
ncbi:MAG: hypothetical protein HY720_28685 [Planctomycetes bacterium]|nr:hypothetical protein [Planctomycetota bacterium]